MRTNVSSKTPPYKHLSRYPEGAEARRRGVIRPGFNALCGRMLFITRPIASFASRARDSPDLRDSHSAARGTQNPPNRS